VATAAPVAVAGGASFTPAPAVDSVRTPSPRPTGTVTVHAYSEYKCQEGDTLQNIAKRAYGSEAYAEALFNYNRRDAQPNTISEQGTVKPGGILFIPDLKYLENTHGALINR
jgi:nucleoid-associated protein YgaU